jgi:GntR family transcriptional regulator
VATAFDRRPLPQRTAEAVEELIVTTGLESGSRLPPETELAARIGVGRSTLRDALALLERAGIIERRWGVGTIVTAPAPAAMGLEVLESLESLAARQGWRCGTTDLRLEAATADEEQARRLGIAIGDPVTVISRTKTRDGVPVARMTSVVPADVVPHDELAATFLDSITELFRALPGKPLALARTEVRPAKADRRLARALGVKTGTSVLVLDEEFLGADGRVLARTLLELLPGQIRVEIVRRTT